MQVSLLQLNINADNYWKELTTYLTTNNFDIIQLQELAGIGTVSGNINSHRDTFHELQMLLQDNYNGELAVAETFTSSPSSYFGNATFYKKQFKCVAKNSIYLHKNEKPFPSNSKEFQNESRAILHLELEINKKRISFLNTHLAWGPTAEDTPIKLEQGQRLIEYVQGIKTPFILTGDFNVDTNSKIVKSLDKSSINLIKQYNITNTLNPETHHATHLFPPGLAVDFIFVSPSIETKDFKIITENISDHYALTGKFKI